ncbi:MAG: zinc ribbon domain-containing protein [Clostridia bacterium]|nr:zinc ribbon domain-containing protein [Clostridia bacterium]
MKKKRSGEFTCVYAGPDFFARRNGEKADENTEPEVNDTPGSKDAEGSSEGGAVEEPDYPDSFKEEDEPVMQRVYAGPDMPKSRDRRRVGPIMRAVYACPPMRPVSDDPPMMAVYAGPDIMSGRIKRKDMPGAFAPKPSDPSMNEVYAGPDMWDASQPDEPGEQLACPRCGAPAAPGMNFCPNCGIPFEAASAKRFCSECGRECAPSDRFCSACGSKLYGAPAAPEKPQRPAIKRKGFIARPRGNKDELV